MGFRLSAIATRTGDDGTTGLGDGSRVAKNDARIVAMGDVDELNSTLGLLRCEALPPAIGILLRNVQNDLFDLGGELSIPGFELLAPERVLALDQALADHNEALPPLAEFILPAGHRSAALAHVARTVCRRAERAVIAIGPTAVRPLCQQYLNRLSDLLFVLARTLNRVHGEGDILWSRER
jgi:cob(I)alamin adenosyltransferase